MRRVIYLDLMSCEFSGSPCVHPQDYTHLFAIGAYDQNLFSWTPITSFSLSKVDKQRL